MQGTSGAYTVLQLKAFIRRSGFFAKLCCRPYPGDKPALRSAPCLTKNLLAPRSKLFNVSHISRLPRQGRAKWRSIFIDVPAASLDEFQD